MITLVSHRLAIILSKHSGRENDVDYLRYGIEILLGGFIKVMALFFTAYVLGVLPSMVYVFLTFALFRSLTGGHHYSTYIRCLLAGLIIIIGAAYLTVIVQGFVSFKMVAYLLCLSTLLGVFLVYRYAPSNHFYKKCTEVQKRQLRKLSFVAIIIWCLLMYFLILFSYSIELILASILGFLIQLCSLHPFTYKMVEKMEALIDRRYIIK